MPDSTNKDLLDKLLDAYGEFLLKQGKSHSTTLNYQSPCRQLIRFAKEKGIAEPKEVTFEILQEFQLFLYNVRDFTYDTVTTSMFCIARFFDFLRLKVEVKGNPARGIKILAKTEAPTKQLAHFYIFEEILRRYLLDQKEWVSFGYLGNVEKHLNGFFKYLLANEIKSVYSVTEGVLIRYRGYLWEEFVQFKPSCLVVRSQIERLRCVVRLFRYLYKEGILKSNPAQCIVWEQYYRDIKEKAKLLPKQSKIHEDLTEMDKLKLKFLEYEKSKGKAQATLEHYRRGVAVFLGFLKEKGIQNLEQVGKRLLLEYCTYLCNYVGPRGRAISIGFKAYLFWSMRLFFRFLVRFDFLPKDPSIDLEPLKTEDGLPRTFMSEKEIFELLEQPRLNSNPLAIRDKAMLEVLFSSGIRSNELCQLNIQDIDQQQEMLRINFPKGGANYQRIIPIGKVALDYLNLYLKEARPRLESGDAKALFLSFRGHRLDTEVVLNMVKKYVFQCGFRKNITPHSFRVTCATLMLKNGADIRYVQEQLGHKKITSTQVYTRLIPLDLKRIHQRTHPRERKNLQEAASAIHLAGVINSQPELTGVAVNDSP